MHVVQTNTESVQCMPLYNTSLHCVSKKTR